MTAEHFRARAPALDRTTWRVLAAFALLFAILVGLRLHGFSLPMWHWAIDDSPRNEVLLGQARFLRMDDWVVHLPLALAQVRHDPPFPVVNRDIGLGQNMLVPFPLPVLHPATLFRPSVWGFFLGPDVGLAWMWWTRVFAFLTAWFLVLRVVTRGRTGLSLGVAVLLLASPFLQFWSLNAAPLAAWGGFTLLAALALATATRRASRLAAGLALGWAGASFFLALYPPYQVVLAWLVVALGVGLLAERSTWRSLRTAPGDRAAGLLLALAVMAVAAISFWLSAHEAIERMAATEYPGRREATGGTVPIWRLLNANLATALQATTWGPLKNLCESASFLLLFPALAVAFIADAAQTRRIDPVAAALLVYVAVLLLWCTVGLPAVVAKLTLLSRVPPARAVLGLGLADALLLARFLAVGRAPAASALWASLGLGAVTAWAAWRLGTTLPGMQTGWLVLLVVANAAAAWLVVRRVRPEVLVGALALGLAATTLWFNPLVRGGSAYLTTNRLAQRILTEDAAMDGRSVWVAYDALFVSNLPRMLGVRSLTGHYTVPQPELWALFDPDGSHPKATNRFAYTWATRRARPAIGFEQKAVDVFLIHVNPLDDPLQRLGATHVLLEHAGPDPAGRFPELELLESVGRHHVFRIPGSPALAATGAGPG